MNQKPQPIPTGRRIYEFRAKSQDGRGFTGQVVADDPADAEQIARKRHAIPESTVVSVGVVPVWERKS